MNRHRERPPRESLTIPNNWLLLLSFLVLTFSFVIPPDALADNNLCAKGLKALAGGRGYIMRKETRCEGFYESPISAKNLQIVSFLTEKLKYDLKKDKSLAITLPSMSNPSSPPVHIRGLSLPLHTYYRLDGIFPSAGTLLWPINEILAPAKLHASRIGVFGWYENDGEKTFVPLRVRPVGIDQDEKSTLSTELTIRSPVEIELLKWRVYSKGHRPKNWKDFPSVPIPAGGVATFTLPSGKAEILNIDIAAKRKNIEKWMKLNKVRLFRPEK